MFSQNKTLKGEFQMKTRQTTALLIAAFLTVALAACGGSKKASTPTEAFKSFYEATKNKDVATLKKLMTKETIAEMEKEAQGKNKSLDDYLADESQKGVPPMMPQLGEEKIEGDKATLQFKSEKATNWSIASFIKEDGDWKVSFK
jgi:ABC-type oligopeptide transport system substrate-binding subunit